VQGQGLLVRRPRPGLRVLDELGELQIPRLGTRAVPEDDPRWFGAVRPVASTCACCHGPSLPEPIHGDRRRSLAFVRCIATRTFRRLASHAATSESIIERHRTREVFFASSIAARGCSVSGVQRADRFALA
jgi:hypothetical protein